MSEPSAAPLPPQPEPLHAASPNSWGRSALRDVALLFRRRRRKLIREIEAATGRALLCYVGRGLITASDPRELIGFLDVIEPGAPITLLLDSPGGEIDPAEKMVHLLREACEGGEFEVVVPYRAKSAATLIALGADRIVMSDSSELGPIDPQVQHFGKRVSVFSWLHACEEAKQWCIEHPDNTAFRTELGKFDPVVIDRLKKMVSRARACAERLSKRQGGNYTAVSAALMDVDRFPSHSQMIDWRTAREIGILHVVAWNRRNQLWQQYWRLYRQLIGACGSSGRIFESRDRTIIL